jgi:hypothetical protein
MMPEDGLKYLGEKPSQGPFFLFKSQIAFSNLRFRELSDFGKASKK